MTTTADHDLSNERAAAADEAAANAALKAAEASTPLSAAAWTTAATAWHSVAEAARYPHRRDIRHSYDISHAAAAVWTSAAEAWGEDGNDIDWRRVSEAALIAANLMPE